MKYAGIFVHTISTAICDCTTEAQALYTCAQKFYARVKSRAYIYKISFLLNEGGYRDGKL